MLLVRADSLKVGDTFYEEDYHGKRQAQIIKGVGNATTTRRKGWFWNRRTVTYEQVVVVVDELILPQHDRPDLVMDHGERRFSPSTGIWIDDRKETA